MKKALLCSLIFAVTLLAVGCGSGPTNRESMSVVDTPEIHYERGKALLKQDNLEGAKGEFEQAISLDAKFAPAYEGLAWYYLENDNVEAADENAKIALDYDGKWALAKLARANVKARQEKYEDAINDAKDAIKDIPKSSITDKKGATVEGYLAMGDIYKLSGQYIEAQTTYQQVLELDKTNMHADKAIKDLAAYQSAVAGQRPELKKIASKKSITRSDVAVLFVIELPLQKVFRQAPTQQQASFRAPGQSVMGKRSDSPTADDMLPPDVPAEHWAKSFIQEALSTNAMEVMPDEGFHPDEEVNRAEFARLIEKFVVRYWNDPGLETKFFGSTSPFFDVNNTSPIFNAVMVVSSRNWMPGFDNGGFKPTAQVSGTEALNVIRKLKADL